TDLLKVTLRASASTSVGSGSAASSQAVADPDFIVSAGFPNRNAYSFITPLPEPGAGAMFAAGVGALVVLARRRAR
ncbi:MAG: hypothetical protein ACQGVC_16250, partial [Myxococcota bacterium]